MFHDIPNNFIPSSLRKVLTNCKEALKAFGSCFPCKTHIRKTPGGDTLKVQLLEQTAAPSAMGVCTLNGFLGAQAISCTLQGRDLPSAGYVLEKPCPFTIGKPWPFFSPGVNCSVGQCGLCVTVPVLGMVSALPLPQSWQRFRSLPGTKAVCRLKAFLVRFQTR